MAQILKDMGITEYEPRVINQMLEFTYSERGRGLCRALGRETLPWVPGGALSAFITPGETALRVTGGWDGRGKCLSVNPA